MELQEKLKQEAIALGLCRQWQDDWGTPSVNDLCDKFIRGIDFCIKHDWPSVDEIKSSFTSDELSLNGIFVTGHHTCREKKCIVVMGDANVTVDVDDYGVCDIYVRHGATVCLNLGRKSWTYVSMYDDSSVVVNHKDNEASLKGFFYGGTIHEPQMFDKVYNKTK